MGIYSKGGSHWTFTERRFQVEAIPCAKALREKHLDLFNSPRTAKTLIWLGKRVTTRESGRR